MIRRMDLELLQDNGVIARKVMTRRSNLLALIEGCCFVMTNSYPPLALNNISAHSREFADTPRPIPESWPLSRLPLSMQSLEQKVIQPREIAVEPRVLHQRYRQPLPAAPAPRRLFYFLWALCSHASDLLLFLQQALAERVADVEDV